MSPAAAGIGPRKSPSRHAPSYSLLADELGQQGNRRSNPSSQGNRAISSTLRRRPNMDSDTTIARWRGEFARRVTRYDRRTVSDQFAMPLGVASVDPRGRGTELNMRNPGPAARRVLVTALSIVWIGHPALAVVINTGDGTGNTSAPSNDPGWANVGTIGTLTGVYLGDGWVLTANHVGDGAIVLQGITYQPIAGSRVRFQKPLGTYADLIAYRIDGQPPLPAIVLADTTPNLGDEATMIGKGWNREAGLTYWDIDWLEVSQPFAVFTGHKRFCCESPTRWGRNIITASNLDIVLTGSTTRSFAAIFDLLGGVSDEAQAVPGDSGGAVFIKRSGQWQLAGTLFAVSIFENQPNSTAVFGQASYAADVAFYRDEILAVITPPPVPVLLPLAAFTLAGALAVLGRYTLRAHRRSTARTSGGSARSQ